MAKACEECTLNCLEMHKKRKDPSSLVTTFFKVMMGDDYAKILYLPPKFGRIVKKSVDETTLEDFNGEKWVVKFTKIDDHLAFKEGWNAFASYHGLQEGDFLVFHYIKKSHFVVLMYGSTGFPENRHFGFPMHETEKNNDNVIVNGQSSSKIHTNCDNLSHESSSKSIPLVPELSNMKTIDNKLNKTNNQHLVATSSQPLDKETDQRSEPLLKNTIPDCIVADSPTIVKPLCLVDNGNGHERDEKGQRSEPLLKNTILDCVVAGNPTTVKPLCLVDNVNGHEQTETGQISKPLSKNTIPDNKICDRLTTKKPSCLVDNSNGHEQDEYRRNTRKPVAVAADNALSRETLETRIKMANEKRKENAVAHNEVRQGDSTHKRPRPANVAITPAKIVKTEPSTGASRLHTNGYPFTLGKLMETETTMNQGSARVVKKEPTTIHGSVGPIKREPKPEPVDYDELPLSGSSNTSFSAIMRNYKYLELPSWVKLKSNVILLRNGTDLWAVLYLNKFGLKVLTQNWGTFAKEKGINPGDMCEFVLESEPIRRDTCTVFDVRVTH